MEETFKSYLFEYRHDGATWGLEIKARDAADAQARLKALSWAQYRGEGVFKINAPVNILQRFARFVSALFR